MHLVRPNGLRMEFYPFFTSLGVEFRRVHSMPAYIKITHPQNVMFLLFIVFAVRMSTSELLQTLLLYNIDNKKNQ